MQIKSVLLEASEKKQLVSRISDKLHIHLTRFSSPDYIVLSLPLKHCFFSKYNFSKIIWKQTF